MTLPSLRQRTPTAMRTSLFGLFVSAALLACAPEGGAPNAAPTPSAAPPTNSSAPKSSWNASDENFDQITYKDANAELSVTCEETKKTLVVTAAPGPAQPLTRDTQVTVLLGSEAFTATAKAGPETSKAIAVTLPANATTVTALMLANNVTVRLTDPALERTGAPTDTGAFDIFGTTCAQVNGLRGG